ncbi:MAG: hypothetical protein RQM95_04215 [Syntrophaceticus schinkii]
MGSISDRELLEMARKVSLFAYSPYSGFSVGAAILSREGLFLQAAMWKTHLSA